MSRRSRRPAAAPGPGPRGWNTPYGGHVGLVVPPPEWRASTVQACGLWPFGVSTGMPLIGVPLGQHLMTGAPVCSDPINWFQGRIIANPSVLVLGRPALGKSSLVRRMALGLAAFGVNPLAVGDLKPDYRQLVESLGGGVAELGRGRGKLNVLDGGAATAIANRLTGSARRRVLEDAHGRRVTVLRTLIRLNRGRNPTEHEGTLMSAALRLLDDSDAFGPGDATLFDLIDVLSEGPERLRTLALDRGEDVRYRDTVDPLVKSLIALTEGAFGEVFAGRTTTPIDITRPLSIDISAIAESEETLTAAVLVACWNEGFAAIEAYQALVAAGLEPQRNWLVILDELWRVLQAGEGMAERVDALTRLDRNKGVGTVMITHTVRDRAESLAERVGYYVFAGAVRREFSALGEYVDLSDKEMAKVSEWSAPESWHQSAAPPGRGKFLIKVGSRPGVPLQLHLTHRERVVGDTNRRWEQATYRGVG